MPAADSQFTCPVCSALVCCLMQCVPTVQGTKAERLEKFEIPAKIVFCLNVGRVWLVTKREKLKTKFQDDLKKLDH